LGALNDETSHEEHGEGHGDHGTGGTGARSGIDHSGHEAMFRRRFWVCLALSVPVLVYSDFVQVTLGYSAPALPGSALIPPVLSVAIFGYGGVPFLRMARKRSRRGSPA